MLIVFCVYESRIDEPMFNMSLFRIKAFSAGNFAGLLASVSRGGLQFMLIIWLQGIWLPLHGYSFERTPLWAGIYLLPLTVAFLVAGPISGWYSDRFGARAFATGGLVIVAVSFVGLMLLPTDFNYWVFAGLLVLNGIGYGMFSSPNTTAIMNSVPADSRGAAAGMRGTFFNAGTSLSIGIFFSMMIIGLSSTLPGTLSSGLQSHGLSSQIAGTISHEPPVGSLFAAFLGANPIGNLLGHLPASDLRGADVSTLTSKEYFPQLISGPFHHGLVIVFSVAVVMSLDRCRGVADARRPLRPRGSGAGGDRRHRCRRSADTDQDAWVGRRIEPRQERDERRLGNRDAAGGRPSVGDVEEERTARSSLRREPVVVDHHRIGVDVPGLIEVLPRRGIERACGRADLVGVVEARRHVADPPILRTGDEVRQPGTGIGGPAEGLRQPEASDRGGRHPLAGRRRQAGRTDVRVDGPTGGQPAAARRSIPCLQCGGRRTGRRSDHSDDLGGRSGRER